MSAWSAGEECQDIQDSERKFEDSFVAKEFQPLDDQEEYLKILENRLKKIKENSGVLSQLKEKREECINNLLNNSQTINTEADFEFSVEIESSKIITHLLPRQPQTIGEIAHLIEHDHLNQQKEDNEQEEQVKNE